MRKKKIVVKTEECDVTFTVQGNSIHVSKKMNPNYIPKEEKEIQLIKF